jgi:hypothetical protein
MIPSMLFMVRFVVDLSFVVRSAYYVTSSTLLHFPHSRVVSGASKSNLKLPMEGGATSLAAALPGTYF